MRRSFDSLALAQDDIRLDGGVWGIVCAVRPTGVWEGQDPPLRPPFCRIGASVRVAGSSFSQKAGTEIVASGSNLLYNKKVKKFPSSIVASLFGFDERPLYKASEGAKDVPSVDFSK